MLKTELYQLIANGENSGVEFKRDDVRPESLAKEVVALANFRGGHILLGVEDDGRISGLQRSSVQTWVMDTVFGRHVHPAIIPFYEEIDLGTEGRIAAITVEQGITKPYVLRHNDREDIYIRVGDTSRIATREQQARLFQESQLLHAEILPVPGTGPDSLDARRLLEYLVRVLGEPAEEVQADPQTLQRRLVGLGLLVDTPLSGNAASIAGLLLFGKRPRARLRQSGLRLMVFPGEDRGYEALLDPPVLDAPLVELRETSDGGEYREPGLIDLALERLHPFLSYEIAPSDASIRRERPWRIPLTVLREALLNAFAHRDWTRAGDVELCVYRDRVEIASPGPLPNNMTVEKMKSGQRSPRNPLLVDILRDYGYVDARGMGVRRKIMPEMRALTGVEPEYRASDDEVRLILPLPQPMAPYEAG